MEISGRKYGDVPLGLPALSTIQCQSFMDGFVIVSRHIVLLWVLGQEPTRRKSQYM